MKFVQLPAMYWCGDTNATLKSVDPRMSAEECLAERSRVLVEFYRRDRPDIVLTEFFPFTPGFFGSTLDALLAEIRNSVPRPLLFCSIRAFPRVKVLESELPSEWIRTCLIENYDGVFHHVDPVIFPLSSMDPFFNNALDGVPVYQTGFVRKKISARAPADCKGILLTVGGGNEKSAVLLRKWIAATELLSRDLGPVHAICGPLMSAEDKASVYRMAHEGLTLYDSMPNLDLLIQQSQAIVCMGGYNTLIEALSLKKPVLSFAGGTHDDQHFHTEQFSERGLLVKGNADWSPHEIARAIEKLLSFSPGMCIAIDGAENTAQILRQAYASPESRHDVPRPLLA